VSAISHQQKKRRGTLKSNGKQFDSSYDRGQPFSFKIGLGQVIRGWDDGVLLMSLGEKAVLDITSDFGYGEEGAGNGVIPPNADLVFEVKLMGINGQLAPSDDGCCIVL
jgi:FKBP-type peptidyl-prolyl cis-trans isomerase